MQPRHRLNIFFILKKKPIEIDIRKILANSELQVKLNWLQFFFVEIAFFSGLGVFASSNAVFVLNNVVRSIFFLNISSIYFLKGSDLCLGPTTVAEIHFRLFMDFKCANLAQFCLSKYNSKIAVFTHAFHQYYFNILSISVLSSHIDVAPFFFLLLLIRCVDYTIIVNVKLLFVHQFIDGVEFICTNLG